MEAVCVSQWITENDRHRSATTGMMEDLARALQPLRGRKFSRLLDIGCGFGGLAALVGEMVSSTEIHGIDVDRLALCEAANKGIVTHQLDIEASVFPFEDDYFDLVLSFGMLDYLRFFDHALEEVSRILRVGGHALISLPNLASWHNRLALLRGYQPRDIEVSRKVVVGVHPWYHNGNKIPTGHVHTVTTKAFAELMAYHGFDSVRVTGGRPHATKRHFLATFADTLLSRNPALARRFFYLGVKGGSPSSPDA